MQANRRSRVEEADFKLLQALREKLGNHRPLGQEARDTLKAIDAVLKQDSVPAGAVPNQPTS